MKVSRKQTVSASTSRLLCLLATPLLLAFAQPALADSLTIDFTRAFSFGFDSSGGPGPYAFQAGDVVTGRITFGTNLSLYGQNPDNPDYQYASGWYQELISTSAIIEFSYTITRPDGTVITSGSLVNTAPQTADFSALGVAPDPPDNTSGELDTATKFTMTTAIPDFTETAQVATEFSYDQYSPPPLVITTAAPAGFNFDLNEVSTSSDEFAVYVFQDAPAVPEPLTLAGVVMGVGALARYWSRKRREQRELIRS
jgi:hypothetical protein